MTNKPLKESFDVYKEIVDKQLQMKITGEDRDMQNKDF